MQIMSNKVYDNLRDFIMILSGAGTLYFALSGIWGWPYGEQINGTIIAVVAFLSVLLKVSRHYYYKPLPVDMSGMQYLEDDEIEAEEAEMDNDAVDEISEAEDEDVM